MKRTTLAVLLLLVVGACAGCSRGKDEVLPDGTKFFGVRTLSDGTKKAARIEHPNGEKEFEYVWLPDGTQKCGRRELPNGEKNFDVISKNGKISNIGHTEFSNGVKTFDTTFLPDGTQKVGRVELPDGKKLFESTQLPGGNSAIKRIEYSDGRVQTDVTLLADGSITENAVAQNSGSPTDTTSNATDLTWESPLCTMAGDLTAAKLARSGSDVRKQVAEALMEVADHRFGPGVVFVSTAGPQNGILLLAATPQNERSLRFFGTKNVQTIRDRAELCAQDGFRQVQLIVRQDDGVNQRLVKKVVLDYDEAKRYMSQTRGARPE